MKFSEFLINELKKKHNVKCLSKSGKSEIIHRIKQVKKLTPFLDNKHGSLCKLSVRMEYIKLNKRLEKCKICSKEINIYNAKCCSIKCFNKYLKQTINPKTGKSLLDERSKKCSITKNTLDIKTGLTNAQISGKKCSETKKINGIINHWDTCSEYEKKRRLKKQYISTRKHHEITGYWRKKENINNYELYFTESKFKHGFRTSNKNEKNLLSEYGVFNSFTNTKGCVRDHLLSRRYGFENNIPVWIISHPANCEIVLHSENVKRSNTNDNQITLNELLERIKIYDRNCH